MRAKGTRECEWMFTGDEIGGPSVGAPLVKAALTFASISLTFRRSLGLSPPANLPEGAINRGRDLLLGEAEVLSPDAMPDPIAKGHN
jgi:hypothetical protein